MRLGPYEVQEVIGRGGLGTVFRARSPAGEDVALKLLGKTGAAGIARFERERRLLGSFTARDGFVPLLDAGTSPEGPWIVMPLLHGGTLRERLARGPLGVAATLELGATLARAMATAHERGIVHRDLKPENVLFEASGRPLVADLGLAKHYDALAPGASQSRSFSQHGAALGTPGYMAPEQVNDAKSAGPAADVFALGAILYECLAGKPAFAGDDAIEIVARVASGSHERLDRRAAPRWLAAVIDRALATDPGARFADGLAFAKALSAPPSGRRWIAGVLGAGVLAAVVAVVAVAGRGAPAPLPPPPGPSLPPRLREGFKVKLPDGRDVEVYLWKLPGNAGELELVRVPAGEFIMGTEDPDADPTEGPRHRHSLDHAFWIGRTHVTWKQYLAFCGATRRAEPERPSWWDVVPGSKDDHPVCMVNWGDSMAYAAWAGLSLPTEVEWEKAARGTDGRLWPWGDDFDPGSRCNFCDATCPPDTFSKGGMRASDFFLQKGWVWDREHEDGWRFTSPIGTYPLGVSPFGALDMAGDLAQWCEDGYDATAYERYVRGDRSASPSTKRAIRGGAWSYPARCCRAPGRGEAGTDATSGDCGFRVLLRAAP